MALTGNSLWGCDLCQLACPRNTAVRPVPMPKDARRHFPLTACWRGHARLAPLIGELRRKARMRIRACLVAACLGRANTSRHPRPCGRPAGRALRPLERRGGWKNVEKFPQYMV